MMGAVPPLREAIRRNLQRGFPGEDRKYLPRDCFEALVTRKSIQAHLTDATPQLLDFAVRSCPKVFAILLCSKCVDIRGLTRALKLCRQTGLVDAQLPLVAFPEKTEQRCDKQCVCPGRERGSIGAQCRYQLAARTFEALDPHEWSVAWEDFFEHQWKFLAPEITSLRFEYSFDERCVLPIAIGDGRGSGNFGEIKEGTIHHAHATGFPMVSISLYDGHCSY